MSLRHAASRCLVALAALGAPWSAAQNYVPSGGFDVDVSGWQGTIPYGYVVWNAEDALGSALSGSAEARNANTGTQAGAISDCFALPSGSFVFGVHARVPVQTSSGNAFAQIRSYGSLANCLANVGPGSSSTSVASSSWTLDQATIGGPASWASYCQVLWNGAHDQAALPFRSLRLTSRS